MNEETNNLIKSLKFLSKIQKGEKINILGMFTQSDGLVTSFSRTFINKDNRQNTLNFIEKTIEGGFNVINKYINSSNLADKLIAKNILEDLTKSKNAILNTKTTYSSDTMYCCTIDTFILNINAKLEELKANNSELFEK